MAPPTARQALTWARGLGGLPLLHKVSRYPFLWQKWGDGAPHCQAGTTGGPPLVSRRDHSPTGPGRPPLFHELTLTVPAAGNGACLPLVPSPRPRVRGAARAATPPHSVPSPGCTCAGTERVQGGG